VVNSLTNTDKADIMVLVFKILFLIVFYLIKSWVLYMLYPIIVRGLFNGLIMAGYISGSVTMFESFTIIFLLQFMGLIYKEELKK
jgi:hypothetical protein